MPPFSFLKSEWPDVCEAAEKAAAAVYPDPRAACFYARRALELAMQWLYRNDETLREPYQKNLSALIHEPTFKTLAGEAIFSKARVINTLGNQAVHSQKPVRPYDALCAVRELFHTGYWLARTYARADKPAPGLAFDEDQVGALPAGWCRCETVKGVYDFKWLDEVVDNLRSRGVQPWFNVGFGNTLYMTNTFTDAAVGCVPLDYGAEAKQAWQAYIRALARHYKGRVTHWEIWNEPNIDAFWALKKSDPLAYLELIRLTGNIIREEIPGSKIGACLSGVLNDYVKRLIEAGVGKEIDFFAIHAYRVQPEKDYLNEIATLRRLFDENGGKQVRLWQGESGFASWFPPNHWLHPTVSESEANQAKWLLRRFITDARAGMELSSFFQMVDMTARPYSMAKITQKDPARHGILHGNTYERKMSFYTMGYYNALFDGDTVLATNLTMTVDMGGAVAPSNCVSKVPVAVGYLRKGVPFYVYYLSVDIQAGYAGLTNVQVTVKNDRVKGLRDPVLVDLLRGGIYEIKDAVRTEQGCVGFKNLPLTDYPLVLTDRTVLAGRIDVSADRK